jgi:hypothetical protein
LSAYSLPARPDQRGPRKERESDGKLVPEADKNMFKNKLCGSQQQQHIPKKKKKNRPRLQKQTPHANCPTQLFFAASDIVRNQSEPGTD